MAVSNLGSGRNLGRHVGSELDMVWNRTHMKVLDSVAICSKTFISLCVAEACRLTNIDASFGFNRNH